MMNGHLIVRPGDCEGKYALVSGIIPTFIVRGWFHSAECKKHPEWLRNPDNRGESWFVPQSALLPIPIKE